jgi:hypothetical protein
MAVVISLQGNTAGDGFLVAPVGANYEVPLTLSVTSGTLAATLQALPDGAGVSFATTSVSLSTVPTVVMIHATLQSGSRGDTRIRVMDGVNEAGFFIVTSIKHPKVKFKGRFEARFATAGAQPTSNVTYTAATGAGSPGPGYTWALEGEPNFVPAVGNVPEDLETTGVGRVIRLNSPAVLRSHVDPVVSTVHSIVGDTTLTPEEFFTGDPLIGQLVNFGPDTYFAGNKDPTTAPAPEEWFSDAYEPMALFELHFGTLFSGRSRVGPFDHKASAIDEKTRDPDHRPIATGLADATPERAALGLPNLPTFSATRIDLLVFDYTALPAVDTLERRNLARRIGHLLSSVTATKRADVLTANPGQFNVRSGTISAGWINKEVFEGQVDTGLVFNPGGSPVIDYMSDFGSFNVKWEPFAFHSDELCAYHNGHLTHLNADGSYSGDPHTRTVNGVTYDFQSVGEFTLLRDASRMEIQVRQTPVPTQHPITDGHTGLTACVSVITAVAARLGRHRIALEPARDGKLLQFYLDGKPANLSAEGIDLGGHRVTTFDANGEMGLRVDFEDDTVLVVTPGFWNGHNIWYMNVSVSNTRADEGIMGFVPRDSWLPRLRNGVSLGPMPTSLGDRYVALYRRFADSWRVTDTTSLFVYAPGTSTKTFTDKDWPAEKPECKVKPEFEVPGAQVHKGMPIEKARVVCKAVRIKDLHENCVFDVATTGDELLAQGYLLAQELRLYGTQVRLAGNESTGQSRMPPAPGDQPAERREPALVLTATVSPLTPGRPTPTGTVTFIVDGVSANRPTKLDERGRARLTLDRLKPGEHKIRATYSGGGKFDYHASSSANLLYTTKRK